MKPVVVLSLLAVGLVAGCRTAVSIVSPAHNAQPALPVQFEVRLRSGATNFRAELDGADITSHFTANGSMRTATLTTADIPSLTPGSAHTFYARAHINPASWSVRDFDDEHGFTVAALPQLTLGPGNFVVAVGGSRNATVQAPGSGPVSVTLQPSNGNIALGSAAAGAPVTLGVSGSSTFAVHGLAIGSSTITASASGFSSASLTVSIPTPDIRVQVSPNEVDVPWGHPAAYTVSVESRNGFAGAVTLTAADLPTGATASFGTNPVTVAAGATASVPLTIATTEAATDVDRTTFEVTGTAGAVSDDDRADIVVGRTEGAFVKMGALRATNGTCGAVTATVVPMGNGPGVQFQSPLGTNNPAARFSAGYQFSPHCRVGFVVPPVGSGGQVWINLHNLLFPASIGAPGIGAPYGFQNAWSEVWFSPDDSLIAVVSPATSSPRAWVINVYDIVRRRNHGNAFFDGLVTGIQLVGRDVRVTATTTGGPNTFDIGY